MVERVARCIVNAKLRAIMNLNKVHHPLQIMVDFIDVELCGV